MQVSSILRGRAELSRAVEPAGTSALAVAPDGHAMRMQFSAAPDSQRMIRNRRQTGQTPPPLVTGVTVALLALAQEAEARAATPVRVRVLGSLMQVVRKVKNGVMIVVRVVKNQPEARNPIR